MSESEIEALKRTVAELLSKKDRYKARIKELETATTELQTKLTASEKTVHDLTIGVPLRVMSESLSTVPELFQEQLTRHYKVELVDGKPSLQTLEGKPVLTKDGKPVPFEQAALRDFLTSADSEHSKLFSAITIVSRASGGSGSTKQPAPAIRETKIAPSNFKFGLK